MKTLKTPEEIRAWRESLTRRESARKATQKVLKIAACAGMAAVVVMAFVVGMRVDHLRSPLLIQMQSPVIWRGAPGPTPVKKASRVTKDVLVGVIKPTPTPMVQMAIVNNIKMDSEQRQNAELIRDAFPLDSRRMIAIAMAESGLRCGSVNHQDSNGVQAVGLFQINDGRLFSDQDITNLTTCAHNIERAQQKYRSQGVTAWGAFTSGAFYKYL